MNDQDPTGDSRMSDDPVIAAAHRRSASMHTRAADVHHEAVALQAKHAAEHAS